jgi:hypothetical protein
MTDTPMTWRKSSYSGTSHECVEVARPGAGVVLVRNSNHPDAGTLTLSPVALGAWLAGCRAGAFDDLTA